MFGKPARMKCGHIGDSIVHLPYNGDFADVLACGMCVNTSGTVNQPAVAIEKIYRNEPHPADKIPRSYTLPVISFIAVAITVIALIASL